MMRKNVLFMLLSVIFVLLCVCIILIYFLFRHSDAQYILSVNSTFLETSSPDLFSNSEEAIPITKININKASREELETLPGIGEVIADRIIEYREQNGTFRSIREIIEVKGIGEAKFDAIKELITI